MSLPNALYVTIKDLWYTTTACQLWEKPPESPCHPRTCLPSFDFQIFLMSPITSVFRGGCVWPSLSESASHECALVPLVNQTCFLASALPGNLLLARMCAVCVGAWKWTHWTAPMHRTDSYESSQVAACPSTHFHTSCVPYFRPGVFKPGAVTEWYRVRGKA